MPHLLIERIRTTPSLCPCGRRYKDGRPVRMRDNVACSYTVEIVDIMCGLMFLIGSACFLPTFARDVDIFLLGCVLFVVGTTGYLIIAIFCLVESLYEKGIESLEACENSLYVAGAVLFNAGTILYWPEKSDWPMTIASKELLPGQYFNWSSPAFEGTVLFIIGSLFFAMAAYVNGLSQRTFETPIEKMFTAATTCYMVGALLLVMGSVAWLPELGCGNRMEEFGAVMYIIGSLFYVIGGVISLIRTSLQLDDPECAPIAESMTPKLSEVGTDDV